MIDTSINTEGPTLRTIVSMALAGVLIAIAGTAYLVLTSKYNNPVFGSVIFSFGLYYICCYGFILYTGRIGYVRIKTIPLLITTLLVNLWTACLTGYVLGSTNVELMLIAENVLQTKLEKSIISAGLDSIMCGMLMFLAVDGFRSKFETRILTIVYCVTIFVLCGFEHCVANAAYIGLSTDFTLEKIVFIIINIVGNTIGSILCYQLKTFALSDE